MNIFTNSNSKNYKNFNKIQSKEIISIMNL